MMSEDRIRRAAADGKDDAQFGPRRDLWRYHHDGARLYHLRLAKPEAEMTNEYLARARLPIQALNSLFILDRVGEVAKLFCKTVIRTEARCQFLNDFFV